MADKKVLTVEEMLSDFRYGRKVGPRALRRAVDEIRGMTSNYGSCRTDWRIASLLKEADLILTTIENR